jgi:NADPH:quinone reductase-like Zn-dependent oxidoreductase
MTFSIIILTTKLDVLVATGVIRLPELTFSCEGAGIVRRIGPNVTKFRVGDRVGFYG